MHPIQFHPVIISLHRDGYTDIDRKRQWWASEDDKCGHVLLFSFHCCDSLNFL